ncbi:hypothetical protein [Streptomyces sp. 4F14]|uniref:hypothetical protein n=1 Tax=Streptomyces sp. 4F14 TaxID=3394380 RepID=UPI003A8686A5
MRNRQDEAISLILEDLKKYRAILCELQDAAREEVESEAEKEKKKRGFEGFSFRS